jgi:hypothetical protein
LKAVTGGQLIPARFLLVWRRQILSVITERKTASEAMTKTSLENMKSTAWSETAVDIEGQQDEGESTAQRATISPCLSVTFCDCPAPIRSPLHLCPTHFSFWLICRRQAFSSESYPISPFFHCKGIALFERQRLFPTGISAALIFSVGNVH